MSAALINRSLTTIRTELEFLRDSEVIDDQLYEKLLTSIPNKYQKDLQPWGVDKLQSTASPTTPGSSSVTTDNKTRESPPPPTQQPSVTQLSEQLANTSVGAPPGAPPQPARMESKPLGYCKSLFDYQAQESDDLSLTKDEKIAVIEHLSEDWWKGYAKSNESKVGVFPSNYVNVISQQEYESGDVNKRVLAAPPPPSNQNEKESYSPNTYQAPPPQYNTYQSPPPAQPPLQQQPSYGGYAQYPPPSTGYYPPQQYQQPPPQQATVVEQQGQSQSHSHLKKFGGKLGNAAIFGAGATIGGDIVNSIF